jgi:glycosyltransferase involved in cell wall biosynthesis
MKILQIHKYFSKKRGGGSVSAFFETKALLEKRGHEVVVFSMHDQENEPSAYSEHFAEHFDIEKAKGFTDKVRLAPKVVYNREAQKKLEALIQQERPEIAHVHNIYHYLTPAILHTLKRYNIPIVFKLSDYKVVCPNYKLYTKSDICTRCRGGKYYNVFFQRCLKDSSSASFLAMVEAYVHKYLKSYNLVDRFLAPSEFMIDTCASFSIPREKMRLLRNVLNFSGYEPQWEKESFFLYMGRVSEEKGLLTLLKAVRLLHEKDALHGHALSIAGIGPQVQDLKKYVEAHDLQDKVHFHGFVKKGTEEWKWLMSRARFSVLSSIWYDNSPIAISESMAFGTPVIVSDRGGTKEMIEDDKSGFVFAAGDERSLAEKMEMLLNDSQKVREFGERGVERVQKINNEDAYYNTLMSYYEEAIQENS